LAGDRQIAAHRDRGQRLDVAAHVENNRPPARAHGIAKRAGSRIVQVRDVIHIVTAPTGCDVTETQRAREGWDGGRSQDATRAKTKDEKYERDRTESMHRWDMSLWIVELRKMRVLSMRLSRGAPL